MEIPVPLNAAQASRLNSLLVHGDPDFLIVDTTVNGSPLFVFVARGDSRKWAMDRLYGDSAPPEPPPVDQFANDPPVRRVPVSDGPSAALPGRLQAN